MLTRAYNPQCQDREAGLFSSLRRNPSLVKSSPVTVLAIVQERTSAEDLCFMAIERSAEERAWRQMQQRCYNPNQTSYKHYGARGIKVADEWRGWPDGFKRFLAHIGLRPSPDHSLDRYPDNNGNYEPGNVRWATQAEQMRNTPSNHVFSVASQSHCISEWAEVTGLKSETIAMRRRRGASPEDAVAPLRPNKGPRKTHCPQGHPLSGDNLYLPPTQGDRTVRMCRACMRERSRAWKLKTKGNQINESTNQSG